MSLAQPEIVIPEQFFALPHGPVCGERSLMLAVLLDAVEMFRKTAHKWDEVGAFEEAYDYLAADDYDYAFSCVNICSVLGIDVGYLRKGLRQRYFASKPVLPRKRARLVSLAKRRKEECAS